ncbi:PEP-CTERM sorting domain-containing protein [Rubripirellula amarantea]|nr:PEP-CTERM sorting domain-containing protein [Rubripirellula amarantea]
MLRFDFAGPGSRSLAALTSMMVMGVWFPCGVSRAAPVTFAFEAELEADLQPFYDMDPGQKLRGKFTFESNTAASPRSAYVTRYNNSIEAFSLNLEGIGTGTGNDGFIDIIDSQPYTIFDSNGQVTSSGIRDAYVVDGRLNGITLEGSLGTNISYGYQINLLDRENESFTTQDLVLTPPDFSTFEIRSINLLWTNTGTGGAIGYTPFQLTSITAVPEPSTNMLMGLGIVAMLLHRRRRTSSGDAVK